MRGKSAHAGRDFDKGANAITPLASFIHTITSQPTPEDCIINVGHIEGGGPVNIVPDKANCQINVRAKDVAAIHQIEKDMHATVVQINNEKK